MLKKNKQDNCMEHFIFSLDSWNIFEVTMSVGQTCAFYSSCSMEFRARRYSWKLLATSSPAYIYERGKKKINYIFKIALRTRLIGFLAFPSHNFSVPVKFGACYITGQWGRVQNKTNITLTSNLLYRFSL